MNIIAFSEELLSRIKKLATEASHEGDIVRKGKVLNQIRLILVDLKAFTVRYEFASPVEEIRFFKEIKPVIYSQYLYSKRIYSLMTLNSFRSRKGRIRAYKQLLNRMSAFVKKNAHFYDYCTAGSTFMDEFFFRRGRSLQSSVHEDEKFTTLYDKILGKILANELTKQYILNNIQHEQVDPEVSRVMEIQWTASKVALVELVYALHASKALNAGKADIRKIAKCFEQMFAIDLTNHPRIFSDIKLRKSGQVLFLDQLKQDLSRQIDDSL